MKTVGGRDLFSVFFRKFEKKEKSVKEHQQASGKLCVDMHLRLNFGTNLVIESGLELDLETKKIQ